MTAASTIPVVIVITESNKRYDYDNASNNVLAALVVFVHTEFRTGRNDFLFFSIQKAFFWKYFKFEMKYEKKTIKTSKQKYAERHNIKFFYLMLVFFFSGIVLDIWTLLYKMYASDIYKKKIVPSRAGAVCVHLNG